jgi:hypothetical protein
MGEEFSNMIKKWVLLDNRLKQMTSEMKTIRDEKNTINQNVLNYVETNNLNDAIIKISDGQLKFGTCKSSQPLTFKYIEECLNDIIDDKDNVDLIINHIKNKRNVKSFMDIKRFYND